MALHKHGNIIGKIGKELKINPPSIIGQTRRKFGLSRANSQRKAILLSKARRGGARIHNSIKGQVSAIKNRIK